MGGVIAGFAAYSYVKLGVYFKDEGATYAFFKRSFPCSDFGASLIGWWVIFGYISTLALYAYTFASYAISSYSFADVEWVRKIEDIMVYTKLIILIVISFILMNNSSNSLPQLYHESGLVSFGTILIVASLTFVAYEGFQLVINAVNEMERPDINIPRAIYKAIALAVFIYVIIAIGALVAIPFNEIIANKEHALASGAHDALGDFGTDLVIIGALLATSRAISGTVFGASRQMSVIAHDGFFPKILAKRTNAYLRYLL